MPSEPTTGPWPTRDDPAGPDVLVCPVVVVSRNFSARPSSIPDAQEFLRTALAGATIEPADLRAIGAAINDAILAAASPSIGEFQVVIRLFPHDAEVEVLSAPDRPASVLGGEGLVSATFAQWLTEALRRQGLSQEAAAQQLGVSVRTVSRWVRGQTEPRLRDVRRISDVFGPVPPH